MAFEARQMAAEGKCYASTPVLYPRMGPSWKCNVLQEVLPDSVKQVCVAGMQASHLAPNGKTNAPPHPTRRIDAESAFDALTTLATTPPGWVCVPVEPTEAMLDAALWTGVFDTNQNGCDADAVTKAYRAMIAAPGAKE